MKQAKEFKPRPATLQNAMVIGYALSVIAPFVCDKDLLRIIDIVTKSFKLPKGTRKKAS